MSDELARARTLILWATVIAGVALLVLVVDLRTKQDLLEVYRREQASPGGSGEPGTGRRIVVDHAPGAHPAPVPHDHVTEPGNID